MDLFHFGRYFRGSLVASLTLTSHRQCQLAALPIFFTHVNAPSKTYFEIRLTLLVKWTAPWLRGIGLFFFFLNIILFIMNCILICTRFHLRPGSFVNSFTDQMESLFISASVSLP